MRDKRFDLYVVSYRSNHSELCLYKLVRSEVYCLRPFYDPPAKRAFRLPRFYLIDVTSKSQSSQDNMVHAHKTERKHVEYYTLLQSIIITSIRNNINFFKDI
jgi:hypothetical protein